MVKIKTPHGMAGAFGESAETPIGRPSVRNEDVIRQFLRDIAFINFHIDEIGSFWAKALGISGPQWMILVAIAELDRGGGVPVNGVSNMLHVDASFVTTQSKFLEKNGFVHRASSLKDARVVLMSLSNTAAKEIASLSTRQKQLNEFIFEEFKDLELRAFGNQVASLRGRFQKALLKIAIDN